MIAYLEKVLGHVTDSFYPRLCPNCGKLSDRIGRHVCGECHRKINLYTHSLCECCGRFIEGHVGHIFSCGTCQDVKPAFDRARAAACYSGVLRDQIQAFKYNQAIWLLPELTDLLEGCLNAQFSRDAVDVVIPVPLHPVRQRERSYNQAALLARALADQIDRRFDQHSLLRIRQTTTQTQLNIMHRHANISGAFQVSRPKWVRQRIVLLVDDVMTTGATLNECARVLKKTGVRAVWAITIARG